MWKVLFKAKQSWPKMNEDRVHDLTHPASAVSFPYFMVYPLSVHMREMSKRLRLSFQGWIKKAERIQCPASLPEDPAIPCLTKMLVPTPYKALEKKAKKKTNGTRGVLHPNDTSVMASEDAETHSAA